MDGVTIRPGRPSDTASFLGMIDALADFERLERPSPDGKKRIVNDIFVKKRINLLLALQGKKKVGYALYFYAYSSFLARPTLYIEDLFVLESERKRGVGLSLFRWCAKEAIKQGCGRMEWAVLDWNVKAIDFYEKLGARRLKEWYSYRLTSDRFESALRKAS